MADEGAAAPENPKEKDERENVSLTTAPET